MLSPAAMISTSRRHFSVLACRIMRPTVGSTGRELARLPVDPTVGRMILQASTEKCLREVLIIAAGLSIQDPRERPLEKQVQADAAHRRFAHADSDFLTLWNIWEAFHDEFEVMSQSRMRRFCHEHFLSYIRMREWRDVHDQLADVLAEREDIKLTSVRDGLSENRRSKSEDPRRKIGGQNAKSENQESEMGFGTPAYRAIHRSILAGLLGNIAVWDEQNGQYKPPTTARWRCFPARRYTSGPRQKRSLPSRRRPRAARRTASVCRAGSWRRRSSKPRGYMRARWPGSIPRGHSTSARTCSKSAIPNLSGMPKPAGCWSSGARGSTDWSWNRAP